MQTLLGIAALTFGLAAAASARAQGPEPEPSTPARKVDIRKVCAAAIGRFCPAETAATAEPRNVVICLRPYRTSLSLSCRAAVNEPSH